MENIEICWRIEKTIEGGWLQNIRQGLLEFNEETAPSLAGPFDENKGYYCLAKVNEKYLSKEADVKLKRRLGQCKDENHLQLILSRMNPKQRKKWDENQANFKLNMPTFEHPYRFFLAGNDDAAWAKFYATEAEMLEDFDLFRTNQPLDLWEVIKNFGFIAQ